MHNQIKIDDICDKNINFIIGSGASYGLFPTLQLELNNKLSGKNHTIETLAEHFEQNGKDNLKTLLFMYYFQVCVHPAMQLDIKLLEQSSHEKVIQQYRFFLETILTILYKKRSPKRRCNIFTTNYDGCIELSADILLTNGPYDFFINDGTRGFSKRYLQVKNFNSFIQQSGIFEQSYNDIPQINCIHLHGSVYWQKEEDKITVDYKKVNDFNELKEQVSSLDILTKFAQIVKNPNSKLSQFDNLDLSELSNDLIEEFWGAYEKLPIVNPEKWKFHETVFEEHYYQMLRALNYELEKQHSIFISFGFSFADEHILNLVKRSLSNPTLQLFICCFNKQEADAIKNKFKGFNNVVPITTSPVLDFETFNKKIFCLDNDEDNVSI